MPAIASSPSRPYVSRRKRRSSESNPVLGSRSIFGFLGLLVLGLLVSLGIIATQLNDPSPIGSASEPSKAIPADRFVSR